MITDDLFEILQEQFPKNDLQLTEIVYDPNTFKPRVGIMASDKDGRRVLMRTHWFVATDEEMLIKCRGISSGFELFYLTWEYINLRELNYWIRINGEDRFLMDNRTGKRPIIPEFRSHPKWPKGL